MQRGPGQSPDGVMGIGDPCVKPPKAENQHVNRY